MQNPTQHRSHLRLVILALGLIGFFGLLIIKFYQIQIIEEDKWTKVANKQHFFIVKEPFLRGKFYSNNTLRSGHPEDAQPFVIDIQKFHLYIDPESLPEPRKDTIAQTLAAMLDISVEEKINFKKQFYRQSRSRKLAMWLDKDTKDKVMKWWMPYAKKNKIPNNALYFVTDYQRSYPFGKMLGQVLHTIQHQKDEKTSQALPTGGLELYFNKYLQGKVGKRRLMRSPRNSLETGEVISLPENGADIYLTINHYIQAIAEEELAKGVKKSKAKAGWAVMMNPYTGEVWALAQYPFFDPLDYTTYFNDPELIEHTKVKAITDANEPGSVMKPFTLATGLLANVELKKRGQKDLFDPKEKMDTSNGHFPGRNRVLTDTHFHHYLNMDMAVQKSSNIYMARIIERVINRLGNDWYRNVLQNVFGFGIKTNIEIPSESKGVLPTIGKFHPNGTEEWSKATPYGLSIGYNIQTNSLQLLRGFAVLVNGGYFVQPTLVRKIVKKEADGHENLLLDNNSEERKKTFPLVLTKEICDTISQVLKYTTKPGGTARRGDIWGYTEGGKTGTPKKIINGVYSETQYCPSFIGFSPAKNPVLVLIVTMDEPEYGYIPGVGKGHNGGVCCAPVFKEIARRTLEYLGIPPDDPYGYPVGDPRYDPAKADWISETRRLQEMYEKWNNKSSSKNVQSPPKEAD